MLLEAQQDSGFIRWVPIVVVAAQTVILSLIGVVYKDLKERVKTLEVSFVRHEADDFEVHTKVGKIETELNLEIRNLNRRVDELHATNAVVSQSVNEIKDKMLKRDDLTMLAHVMKEVLKKD